MTDRLAQMIFRNQLIALIASAAECLHSTFCPAAGGNNDVFQHLPITLWLEWR